MQECTLPVICYIAITSTLPLFWRLISIVILMVDSHLGSRLVTAFFLTVQLACQDECQNNDSLSSLLLGLIL